MTVPIRAFPLLSGAGVDDPNATTLLTCLRESDAELAVKWLVGLQQSGALVPDDATRQFFTIAKDVDVAFDITSVAELVARGVTVRSVVIATADIPEDKVLATIAGSSIQDGPAAAPPPSPSGTSP